MAFFSGEFLGERSASCSRDACCLLAPSSVENLTNCQLRTKKASSKAKSSPTDSFGALQNAVDSSLSPWSDVGNWTDLPDLSGWLEAGGEGVGEPGDGAGGGAWTTSLAPLRLAAIASAYALVVAVSLFGNGLVVYVVARHRHLRSVTHTFLANVALSDLLMTYATFPNFVLVVIVASLRKRFNGDAQVSERAAERGAGAAGPLAVRRGAVPAGAVRADAVGVRVVADDGRHRRRPLPRHPDAAQAAPEAAARPGRPAGRVAAGRPGRPALRPLQPSRHRLHLQVG